MASRTQNANFRISITFVLAVATFLGNATPALAKENLPTLSSFIESVRDGNAKVLKGVYIKDVMAYPVLQQPAGNAGYVSTNRKAVTQFRMAAEAGNVGLLAHNYLAGLDFTQLAIGQQVDLVYGDGRVESFIIARILRFQALDPKSTTSDFKPLDGGATIKAEELFRQVYRGDRHVTFQTCIESDGNSSWGRLFIIAEPK